MKVKAGPFLLEMTREEMNNTMLFYTVDTDINLGTETANSDETHILTLKTLKDEE